MTQEQKAKAYDEALEWMRKVYPTLTGADKEDAEHYFPELSEDERIRLFICDLITRIFWGRDWNISKKDCLAYLEKQKEQKPVENGGKELLYVSNKSYNIGYRDGKRAAEQKPAEWSEKDEEMLDAMIDIVSNSYYEPLCPREGMLAWLKSLPGRFNPQPKQEWSKAKEWSEADEVYLEDALWCVKQATKVAKGENDMGACWSAERWLKSLRPSWKPSEDQMEALRRASTNEYVSEEQFDILVSLYEQLKKL